MSWASLVFELDASQADALSDELLEQGALSVESEDAAAGTSEEKPIFDEPGEDTTTWPRLRLRLLAHDADEARKLLSTACAKLQMAHPAQIRMDTIEETDWVRLTQSQFAPIHIGKNIWVVPSWHEAPDPDGLILELDPGLAFGTGSHPTTRLCMEWLEAHPAPGKTVLTTCEFISQFLIPARAAHSGDAYLRFIPRTEMDIAVASAGVCLTLNDAGVCTAARVSLGAVAPRALLVAACADALIGSTLDDAALAKLAAAASAACAPINDKRGTIEFRTKVAGVLARRAATIAAQRARGN